MGRAHKIMVNEITTGWWPVNSGVPQECVLQTILFESYTHVIYENV